MANWAGWVFSVRRGCFSENKIHGESLPFEGTFGIGAVGRFGRELGKRNEEILEQKMKIKTLENQILLSQLSSHSQDSNTLSLAL